MGRRVRWLITILPLVLLLTLGAAAQPVVSPEVAADGRVTFRLRAPLARTVEVRCESLPRLACAAAGGGLWAAQSPPLAPDIYLYSFFVDGVELPDPANPRLEIKWGSLGSQLELRGDGRLPWFATNVPAGRLHQHHYYSAMAGETREFQVYTPPGYSVDGPRRYPVLHLLHGYTEDAGTWIQVGRAGVILDNLIAQGRARPMVLVMPSGYGVREVLRTGFNRARQGPLWEENIRQFRRQFLAEILPQVAAEYHVGTNRSDQAIAGISMGATEALAIGLNTPDQFGWVLALSPGGLNLDFAVNYIGYRPPGPRIWLSCGGEDALLGENQQLHQWLTAHRVAHEWASPSGGHNYRLWRRQFAELLPRLFAEPVSPQSPPVP